MGIEDQGWVAWFVLAAALGREITIFGSGKQVRDLLYVDDLLDAYELAGGRDRLHAREGVQHRRGGAVHDLRLARVRAGAGALSSDDHLLGCASTRHGPETSRCSSAIRGRAERLFGWQPSTPVEEGVGRLADWILEQRGRRSGASSPFPPNEGSCQALTYYRPHLSGLTIYVERLAHALECSRPRGDRPRVAARRRAAAGRGWRRRSRRPSSGRLPCRQGRGDADARGPRDTPPPRARRRRDPSPTARSRRARGRRPRSRPPQRDHVSLRPAAARRPAQPSR